VTTIPDKLNENNPFKTPLSTTPTQRNSGVRWWLILSIFCAPVLLLTLGTFLFRLSYTIRENSGRKAMAVEIQKLESEGNAIDNESIDVLYRSRTSVENQEDWLILFATLDSPEFKKFSAGVPLLDSSIDDDQPFQTAKASDWEYAEACLTFTAKYQELIEKSRLLAASPTPSQFPIYFQSTETLLPEVQSVRQVAIVVFIDWQVALQRRNSQRATQDIITLYSLANQSDVVPITVSRLVGIAIRRLALEALQACIEVDLLNDEQLGQIDEKLQSYCEIGDRWHSVISEELGLHLPVFTNPSITMKSKARIPAQGHDAVYFIDLMRRAMALETEDWSGFYSTSLMLESELDIAGNVLSIQTTDRILSHLLAPAFGALAAALINDAQMHRQARLATAIRLHAHRTNQFPLDLEELSIPAAQFHPIGTESFGYQLEEDRAVLWGFELSKEVRQTPTLPPNSDPGTPGTLDNSRFVWIIARTPS